MLTLMDTRTCKTCGHVGPLDDFEPHPRYKYGHMPYCRPCRSADSKRRAEATLAAVDPAEAKTCRRCGVRKTRADFYSLGTRTPDCKECRREVQNSRYHSDPERHSHRNREYRYGVSREKYEQMLTEQDGRCAICGATDPGRKSFAVDHDHRCCPGRTSCGECVRGLLCMTCNSMLGHAGDRAEVLDAAAAYLRQQLWG